MLSAEILRRFDPDAHSHTGSNDNERGSPGFTVSLLGVRGEHPNERIPLVLTVKDPALAEGDDFVRNTERMIEIERQTNKRANALRAYPHSARRRPGAPPHGPAGGNAPAIPV